MTLSGAVAALPRPDISPERARFIAFFAMVVGMFMAVLDIQIVAASLPQIQAGLGAGPEEVSWIQTSYLIAEVMMIPITGFLSRAISTRVLFTISAVGFCVASIGCGLAWSLPMLIFMRVLQGFIGGAMIPLAGAVVFTGFPRERAASLSALVGLTVTFAPTIGPSLGGFLTEHFSWRMLFFINLVPGAFVIAAVWLYANFDEPEKGLLRKFNLLAFAMMATALGLLEYILEEGAEKGWFQSGEIVILSVVCVLATIGFLRRTLPSAEPIVDFRAFRNRNFTAGSLIMLAAGATLFSFGFLLPLFLARVQGLNAMQTGWTLMAGGIAMFFAAPFAGGAARKLDPRLVAGIGLAFVALGSWRMTYLTAEWSYFDLLWPQAARGFGMMLAMSPITVMALSQLDAATVRTASPVFSLLRNLGGAIGLAVLNTVLHHRTAEHSRALMDNFSISSPVYAERAGALAAHLALQGAAEPDLAAAKILAGIASREAEVIAYSNCFALIVVFCLVSIVLLAAIKEPKWTGNAEGAH